MSFFNFKTYHFTFIIGLVFLSCGQPNNKQKKEEDNKGVEEITQFKNPVLQGDFADPSVVRVGSDYWATATSSEWAPLYPILHSKNLQDWEIVGHVFPDSLPDWAESRFWAPEISYENGKFYIYYTAKKIDGPLCVGVASSDNAAGPYTDHGPIVCQEAGAIDGFAIRDENGKLYLIWKEDGNSRNLPTPMWGQEMNEERTELIGERFELFRNDPTTWEGNLVEGAYLIKRDDFYYAFYSGDACCGRGCTYGIGVARAKDIRGPWEKYSKNPLKQKDADWKCVGHGTLVESEAGRYFFLYHGYSTDGTVFTGRQGLLEELVWGDDGWPKFKDTSISRSPEEVEDVHYDFDSEELGENWQWPVGSELKADLKDGKLVLESSPEKSGSIIAHRVFSPDYEAITEVSDQGKATARAGISAIGDTNRAVGISTIGSEVVVWKLQDGKEEILARQEVVQDVIQLKISVEDGKNYRFYWSEDGEEWNALASEGESIDGSFLPPWDRAVRIGLVSKGPKGAKANFNFLHLNYPN